MSPCGPVPENRLKSPPPPSPYHHPSSAPQVSQQPGESAHPPLSVKALAWPRLVTIQLSDNSKDTPKRNLRGTSFPSEKLLSARNSLTRNEDHQDPHNKAAQGSQSCIVFLSKRPSGPLRPQLRLVALCSAPFFNLTIWRSIYLLLFFMYL